MVISLSTMIAPASDGSGEAWANTLMAVATPPGQPQSIELCAIRWEPEPTTRIASELPMAPYRSRSAPCGRDRR